VVKAFVEIEPVYLVNPQPQALSLNPPSVTGIRAGLSLNLNLNLKPSASARLPLPEFGQALTLTSTSSPQPHPDRSGQQFSNPLPYLHLLWTTKFLTYHLICFGM